LEIGQVLVVCPDQNWMLGPLEPVSPFLQGEFYGKKFPVSNIIVLLRR